MSETNFTKELPQEKYGMLVVLRKRRDGNRVKCFCRCVCGTEREFREDKIKSGRIISCGCKRSSIGGTHGYCRGDGAKKASYRAWGSMLSRCNNNNHKSYGDYGARGIRVCERWSGKQGYPNFLADMGEPSYGMSLDRIDNDGNYEPNNCRWATRKTQQRNTRRNFLLTHNGETLSISEWAERLEVSDVAIRCRLKRGWSVERAVTTPTLKPEMKNLSKRK